MSTIKAFYKQNPNCMDESYEKEIEIYLYYNQNQKAYDVNFSKVTRSDWSTCSRIDFKPRNAYLAVVGRKSPKVERILTKWLEENLDGLFRQFVWCGGDNMYGVVQYIEEHKPEGVNFPECNYRYEPKMEFHDDYMPCSDTWEVLGNCGKDVEAIKDKYDELETLYASDYKMFTDLVLNVNHMCWMWYNRKNEDISRVFSDLYYHSKDKFYELFGNNSEATDYFFDITD